MKKIIITGALGHIGSSLIRALPETFPSCEILMIDNLLTQRYCSLFQLPEKSGVKYWFIEEDIFKLNLREIFQGADAVVHLAAITDAASSFDKAGEVERVNLDGARIVAEACAASGAPLVFLSTTSVYGSQADVVDESCQELQPQSPYADSKLKAEMEIRRLGEESGLRYITFRFGTIFGASPGIRFHTAVNKFIWQAIFKKPITVWSTAFEQKRPYLSLEDGVQAIAYAIEQDLFPNDIFNVVTLNASVKEITETIKEVVGEVKIEFVEHKIMNQLSYHVLGEKFAKLGFKICGDLKRGVEETVGYLSAL
jgi:UDP-glucose 4-epimerase